MFKCPKKVNLTLASLGITPTPVFIDSKNLEVKIIWIFILRAIPFISQIFLPISVKIFWEKLLKKRTLISKNLNFSSKFLNSVFYYWIINFRRDHKMALVQLPDVEQAINALIELHNYKLADNAHLRVSFSKKGITV